MTPSEPPPAGDERPAFTGEEGGGDRSTPRKDLGAAVVIGAGALAAMAYSTTLEVPTTLYTAPGLFPFLTGLTLLLMAIGLGARALRAGGAQSFWDGCRSAAVAHLGVREARRTLFLMALVSGYVAACALIGFDLRWQTPVAELRFSSWEAISIPVLAYILWFFWRGAAWKCLVIAAVTVFTLAVIFRSLFLIPLPAAG